MTAAITCERCEQEYPEGEKHECKPEGDEQRGEDLTKLLTEVRELAEGQKRAREQSETRIEEIVSKIAKGDGALETPSKQTASPIERVRVLDVFDQAGYDRVPQGIENTAENRKASIRANLELGMMNFEGTQKMPNIGAVEAPEYFRNAWVQEVFESDVAGPPMITQDGVPQRTLGDGNPIRAMDTGDTGFGKELMGTQYVRDMWEAARNTDSLVGSIREIPLLDNSGVIPIDGDLPEMLFVGESTSASASNYTTSKTGSNKVTMAPRKFTIQQVWSAELNEDSIIAYTPFLREKLNMSAALYLGSAYLNGDITTGGSDNINKDDGTPGAEKHYLAGDGIRRYWLRTDTGQGKDQSAVFDQREINVARGKLNAGDDDIDNLIKNINWGQQARELRLIMDWDTYMSMLDLDDVQTIDKYGARATVVTGELASYKGIPIIVPAYASKTEADGKASDTESNNTKGQITLVNPQGWLGGNRRGVQLFFDRIQRTDQFLFELYTRRAFTRFGTNVAAGIYNITV